MQTLSGNQIPGSRLARAVLIAMGILAANSGLSLAQDADVPPAPPAEKSEGPQSIRPEEPIQTEAEKKTEEELVDILPPPLSTSLIDLQTAFALAEAQNPSIGLSRERICEAAAQHKEARAVWLPTLNAGTNYHWHGGVLATSYGQIRSLHEQSIYVGGGARTMAAETVAIPAISFRTHLGDAYYKPLAAGQVVTARTFDAMAINNLTLLDVAQRYLDLVSAEARRQAIRATYHDVSQIQIATEAFAKAGQGRDADARRARTEALLMQLEEQRLQEEVGVASAELNRILHLDPSVQLTTPPGPIEIIELVDIETPVDALVSTAQYHRPEVTASSAEIGAAEYQLRLELTRPYLPLVSVGFSAGGFGGGSDQQLKYKVDSYGQIFGGRTDFDVMAVWTLQNLGVGNQALQSRGYAEREQAIRERSLALANIRYQVTQYLARAKALRQSIEVAWTQLNAAEQGAAADLLRTRSGEGLPIESLNSVTRLANARRALIQSVINYNATQFQLFVSLGSTPR